MATTKFYLDSRRASEHGNTLRINICQYRKTAAFSLGIKLMPNQWDSKANVVINHPDAKFWNNFIHKRKVEIDSMILKLEDQEPEKISSMTAIELRDYLQKELSPEVIENRENARKVVSKSNPKSFLIWFDRFMNRKTGRTQAIYKATRKRLVEWMTSEEKLSKVMFEDIKVTWLEDFEDFLSKTAGANANAIHLRNIKAVVNYAIDNDITTYYAFRRFKIKTEATRKRNFDIPTLRRIFNHQCEEEWQQKYLDFFKLSFLLIGINVVDLCNLEKISGGRIEYIRAKTHRPYSIKVEKEAIDIIVKYKGHNKLVNFSENYQNYRHFYNNLCIGLKGVKDQLGLEELTTYWARHSWATIAKKLRINKDTIALALGHGGHTVTDIYIDNDLQEVDEANRKVIDYVLYGEKLESLSSKKRSTIKKSTVKRV